MFRNLNNSCGTFINGRETPVEKQYDRYKDVKKRQKNDA